MKKKILILIFVIILVVIVVFTVNLIKKTIIIEKIKDGLESRTDYYHIKCWTDSNQDYLEESWKYPNGIEMKVQDNHTLVLLVNNDIYTIDTIQKSYIKNQTDYNTSLAPLVMPDDFMLNFVLNDNSIKIALMSSVSIKTIDGKKCFEIKNKQDGEEATSYIDINNFDLVRMKNIRCEWEKLDNKPTVEEILNGYTEVNSDNLDEVREFYRRNRNSNDI